MRYSLISGSDFAALPMDRTERFLALEEICRRNLNGLIDDQSTRESDQNLRLQYMSTVTAAAEELGISGIKFPSVVNPEERFDNFMLGVVSASTKLRLRTTDGRDGHSVRLSVETIGLIDEQVQRLRKVVLKSDLPEDTKQRLFERLRELSEELHKPRVSFARVMAILAIVGASVATTTGFLASAPEALTTITALIGADKEAEDKETKRLGVEERKSLPSPPNQIPTDNSEDDDIPF